MCSTGANGGSDEGDGPTDKDVFKALIDATGLTLKALTEKLGKGRQSLSGYGSNRDERRINPEVLERLLDFLRDQGAADPELIGQGEELLARLREHAPPSTSIIFLMSEYFNSL